MIELQNEVSDKCRAYLYFDEEERAKTNSELPEILFSKIDTNKTGKLDQNELIYAFEQMFKEAREDKKMIDNAELAK